VVTASLPLTAAVRRPLTSMLGPILRLSGVVVKAETPWAWNGWDRWCGRRYGLLAVGHRTDVRPTV